MAAEPVPATKFDWNKFAPLLVPVLSLGLVGALLWATLREGTGCEIVECQPGTYAVYERKSEATCNPASDADCFAAGACVSRCEPIPTTADVTGILERQPDCGPNAYPSAEAQQTVANDGGSAATIRWTCTPLPTADGPAPETLIDCGDGGRAVVEGNRLACACSGGQVSVSAACVADPCDGVACGEGGSCRPAEQVGVCECAPPSVSINGHCYPLSQLGDAMPPEFESQRAAGELFQRATAVKMIAGTARRNFGAWCNANGSLCSTLESRFAAELVTSVTEHCLRDCDRLVELVGHVVDLPDGSALDDATSSACRDGETAFNAGTYLLASPLQAKCAVLNGLQVASRYAVLASSVNQAWDARRSQVLKALAVALIAYHNEEYARAWGGVYAATAEARDIRRTQFPAEQLPALEPADLLAR